MLNLTTHSKIMTNSLFIFWGDNCFTVCSGLCHTSMKIRYRYRYIPSLMNLPPSPYPQTSSLKFRNFKF